MKLVHQGMILGEDNQKMSKSRGNVVNPDDIVREYGADALRLYEMFMGPLEAVKPWQTAQIQGVVRFRDRLRRGLSPAPSCDAMDDATQPAAPPDHQEGQHGHRARWPSIRPSPP